MELPAVWKSRRLCGTKSRPWQWLHALHLASQGSTDNNSVATATQHQEKNGNSEKMEMCKSMQIFQKTRGFHPAIRAPCPKLFLAIWSGTSRTSSRPGTVTKWGFEPSNWKIVGKVLWSGHFPNLSLKIILKIHLYILKLKIVVLEKYDDVFFVGPKSIQKLWLPLLEWWYVPSPFFSTKMFEKNLPSSP